MTALAELPTRSLAVEDRRRITKPGMRRALRRATLLVRCPVCNRSGSLGVEGGHRGGCWSCGAQVNLRPTFWLVPSPWNPRRPPRWQCQIDPRSLDS